MSSDRGLCGAIHSAVCKLIKSELTDDNANANTAIVCVGDKARAQLQSYVQFNTQNNFVNNILNLSIVESMARTFYSKSQKLVENLQLSKMQEPLLQKSSILVMILEKEKSFTTNSSKTN